MGSIEAALAECELYEAPVYAHIAKKHGIQRSTLSRRHRGITGSQAQKNESQSLLNDAQARRLINEVNRLSERGTPPTVAMLRTFACNISKIQPGINWASTFVRAHADELKSVYLRGFDLARKKADNWLEYCKYFQLVCSLSYPLDPS